MVAFASGIGLVSVIVAVIMYRRFKNSSLKRDSQRAQLLNEFYRQEAAMNDELARQQILQQTLTAAQWKKISATIHDEIMSGMTALRYRIAYSNSKNIFVVFIFRKDASVLNVFA